MSDAAPEPVEAAVRLWRASAVCAVLASALSVLIVEDLLAVRGRALPADLDPAQDRYSLLVGGVIGVVLVAGVSAVVLLVAARMRDGRGWARTVLAVLGGLAVAYGVLTIAETFALFGVGLVGALVGLLTLANIGLVAAAVSFMFRPPAGAWFARP
ncbi:MAG: hypothetical protein ACT4RN_12015 [Pseudonocardia sp.]